MMTGNPTMRFPSSKRRKKRPCHAAFSGLRKFPLASLGLLAMAVACRSLAQEDHGSPDGLYAVPEASRVTESGGDSLSDRAMKEYLKSLHQHSESSPQNASAAHAPQNAPGKEIQSPAVGGSGNFVVGDDSPADAASISARGHLQLPARAWIAILVCGGLFAFLAGGWAWWSHSRRLSASRAVLLPLKPQSWTGTVEKPEPGVGRRAA